MIRQKHVATCKYTACTCLYIHVHRSQACICMYVCMYVYIYTHVFITLGPSFGGSYIESQAKPVDMITGLSICRAAPEASSQSSFNTNHRNPEPKPMWHLGRRVTSASQNKQQLSYELVSGVVHWHKPMLEDAQRLYGANGAPAFAGPLSNHGEKV